jgi:hypothetical protein
VAQQQKSLILSSSTGSTTQVEQRGQVIVGDGENLDSISNVTGINTCGRKAQKG